MFTLQACAEAGEQLEKLEFKDWLFQSISRELCFLYEMITLGASRKCSYVVCEPPRPICFMVH